MTLSWVYIYIYIYISILPCLFSVHKFFTWLFTFSFGAGYKLIIWLIVCCTFEVYLWSSVSKSFMICHQRSVMFVCYPSFKLYLTNIEALDFDNPTTFWPDFCCSYVVDAADPDNLTVSRGELHDLLSKASLNGIPLLVLGNKIDKPGALSKPELTEQM